MTSKPISRYPVPDLQALPEDISALFALSNRMANFLSLRPNEEFYLMGRVPKK